MSSERTLSFRLIDRLDDQLYIPDQRRYVCIRQSEILYVKGARSSVELAIVGGGHRVVSTHLSHFQTYLNPELFIQVSRSYIINRLHIASFSGNDIEVGGRKIVITASHRESLKQRLTLVRLRSEREKPASP